MAMRSFARVQRRMKCMINYDRFCRLAASSSAELPSSSFGEGFYSHRNPLVRVFIHKEPQVGRYLGHHPRNAGPRCGTPRASPRPPGAPGGDIRVMPEVFLTPSRARATVYITPMALVCRVAWAVTAVERTVLHLCQKSSRDQWRGVT